MLTSKSLEIYQKYNVDIRAIEYALSIISWDSETIAPKGCFEERGKQISTLSKQVHILCTSKEYISAVYDLYAHRNELDEILAHEIITVKKQTDRMVKVPTEEFGLYQMTIAKSQMVWEDAKHKNDYSLFAPVLKDVIKQTKKMIKYWSTSSLKGYDVLLDLYEPGYKQAKYDKFFKELRNSLVPFTKKVIEKEYQPRKEFLQNFSIEKQKEVCAYIAKVMCFDLNYGVMSESEHPFTDGLSPTDVRITNHFYENMFTSSLFSALHELGHATYERNVSKDLYDTNSCGGGSMALHESQSRFYENIIGRSYDFWKIHYSKLKEIYKQELKKVPLKDFYRFINEVKKSYIRVEADELTYPLHIMLRYQIEKEIFSNKLDLDNLEKRWNELFYEYFGFEVDRPVNGILQDSHWSGGAFGYFPTYALGSAYASQIFHSMNRDFDVKKSLLSGTTEEINNWLKEKIHRFGKSKSTKDILIIATGKPFNPRYYTRYLINKYSKLYEIKR